MLLSPSVLHEFICGFYLLVNFKVLGSVSPQGGQNVTPRTGQWITDQEIAVTLHKVFCNLWQYRGLHVGAHTHINTQAHHVCLHCKHQIKSNNSHLLQSTGALLCLVCDYVRPENIFSFTVYRKKKQISASSHFMHVVVCYYLLGNSNKNWFSNRVKIF